MDTTYWKQERCSGTGIVFKLLFEDKSNRGSLSLQSNDDLNYWSDCAQHFLAFDGFHNYIVRRDSWALFASMHHDVIWVTYGIEYEYNILWRHFQSLADDSTERIWTNLMSNGQMKDILIIDALVRLALTDDDTLYQSVKEILTRYGQSDLPEVLPGKLFTNGMPVPLGSIFLTTRSCL